MSLLFRFKLGPDPQTAVNHDIENDLAISAESPDAMTWTVKLRPDTRFQNVPPVNGHAVEAEDIRATFARALTLPQNPSRGTLSMIDPNQITTPAKDTVVFKLRYPYAPFLGILASPTYSRIFPREVANGAYDPAKQIIGSGPFLFDNYTPDVALSFRRNPDYYEKGLPYVDGARLAIIPDQAQVLAQFGAGNLASITNVQPNDLAAVKRTSPNARDITAPPTNSNVIYFQLGDSASPFQDIRLRRAVSMALDRDAIAKALYANQSQPGFYVPASMGKWALTMNQLDAGVQQFYKFDLAQAKSLFAAAGGAALDMQLVYPTNYPGAPLQPLAEAIHNMLQALPWKISLSTIDYAKDYIGGGKGALYGNFPSNWLVVDGISPFSETDQFLYGYYDSHSTSNQERVKDASLDALIEKARTTTDVEQRRKAYLDVQKYLADKMYTVQGMPMGYAHTVVHSWVSNYNYTPENGNNGYTWSRVWLTK